MLLFSTEKTAQVNPQSSKVVHVLLPLEGSILHHGSLVVDSEGRRSLAKQPFGLTLQSNGLLGDETVENHLSTVCSLSGMKTDLLPLLDAYGLAHRRYDRIGQLSGGQARKVAVLTGLLPAMLSREPRLVLLDEPATGLDERALARLISDIGQLREAGHAFVIASHHPEMMKCATRLHDLESETSQESTGKSAVASCRHRREHQFTLDTNRSPLPSFYSRWFSAKRSDCAAGAWGTVSVYRPGIT